MKKQDLTQMVTAMLAEVRRKPPTFAMIGLSGSGKSSVINRLFNTSLKVSHTRAGTKQFISTDIELKMAQGPAVGEPVNLRVIDCPGLGEDIALEEQCVSHYRQHLPEVDGILYVSAARSRGAVALEQQHLAALKGFCGQIVWGLSQIDLLEGEWNDRLNRPSEQQAAYVAEICEDRAQRFASVVGREVKFIPFSSRHGFGLQSLFTALLMACPAERAWVFESLKAFDFRQFVPAAALKALGTEILKPQQHE